MIRTATSPRWATSTFLNISLAISTIPLNRRDAVLLGYVPLFLEQADFKSTDKDAAGILRLNHIVNHAAGRGHVWIVEFEFVIRLKLLALCFRIFCGKYVLAKKDIYSTSCAHYSQFGVRPGVKQISTQPFAAHHTVSA